MKAAAMAHPHHHALSSVKKWGGDVSDYIPLHEFFDQSKSHMADFRHRAYRHHALGIFQLEQQFGRTITLSTGRVIPTRWVGEQHVKEDLGRIPTLADWLRCIRAEPWMSRSKKVSEALQEGAAEVADDDASTSNHDKRDQTGEDGVVSRATAVVESYSALRLLPPDTSNEGIAAIVADLFHLATIKGANDNDILSIIDLARTYHRAEHGNIAA